MKTTTNVELAGFYQHCLQRNRPIVFDGLFKALPELQKWTPALLREVLHNRSIMVNVSDTGLFHQNRMESMLFQDYVDYVESATPEQTSKRYMQQAAISGGLTQGCFAELSPYVATDRYFPPNSIWEQNLWFGPAGCNTGLHFDIPKNFFMQLYGRKTFYLVAPGNIKKLYAHSALSGRANFSQVDLTSDYQSKYPLAKNLDVIKVTLEPGMMLYLPECWWHQVYSIETSISVNYWTNSQWIGLLPEQIQSLPVMGRGLIGGFKNLLSRKKK
jgi:hypothetical protein